MIGGWNGPAFASGHAYVGGNSSIRVASALAIGGMGREHPDARGRRGPLGPAAPGGCRDRVRPQGSLAAPPGAEGRRAAAEWGSGPDGNWRVLAGYLYYFLANRPPYDAWSDHPSTTRIRPLWHIKHGRTSVGLKLLPRVLAAIPVSLWRWSRGRRLIDPAQRRPGGPADPQEGGGAVAPEVGSQAPSNRPARTGTRPQLPL